MMISDTVCFTVDKTLNTKMKALIDDSVLGQSQLTQHTLYAFPMLLLTFSCTFPGSLFLANSHPRMLLWLSALLKQVARMYQKCI